MQSVAVGSVSLSVNHLLIVLALAIALVVGGLLGRRWQVKVSGSLLDIFVGSMVFARAGFVLRYHEYYDTVWSVIDIRDRGFDIISGLVGCLLLTAWVFWRRAAMRKPLLHAMLAGFISWGVSAGLIRQIEEQALPMPQLTVQTLEQQMLDIYAIAPGQPMVVNLWATWCPPCVREMPVLIEARQRFPDVTVIFVNQGESTEVIRRFLEQQQLDDTHMYSDISSRMGQMVGSRALPTTLFYDAGGQLVHSHMGELSMATLARGIEYF